MKNAPGEIAPFPLSRGRAAPPSGSWGRGWDGAMGWFVVGDYCAKGRNWTKVWYCIPLFPATTVRTVLYGRQEGRRRSGLSSSDGDGRGVLHGVPRGMDSGNILGVLWIRDVM